MNKWFCWLCSSHVRPLQRWTPPPPPLCSSNSRLQSYFSGRLSASFGPTRSSEQRWRNELCVERESELWLTLPAACPPVCEPSSRDSLQPIPVQITAKPPLCSFTLHSDKPIIILSLLSCSHTNRCMFARTNVCSLIICHPLMWQRVSILLFPSKLFTVLYLKGIKNQ